ncbi:hypothetical protein [Enhygromyxa salina]|uniref:Uncharacterized protein n=1 Tax=Enhygromyxa salina TaxID=215803 RepID=A0A2S9YAB5_9BACT|nr:hypothetical protein [Enhygromyxa salina]PRQ02043.1 hypothetical protein ENSA7_56160 [Enhygromyxa salina]
MATTRKPQTPPPDRDGGPTSEDLSRDLGLDDFSYEACFSELFAELLDEPTGRSAPTRSGEGVRVTQAGPGRRNGPNESK